MSGARMFVVGVALVALAGCDTQECAYYNDCPSGAYCSAEGACVAQAASDQASSSLGVELPAGGNGTASSGAVAEDGRYLRGTFGAAGTFSDRAPTVVLNGGPWPQQMLEHNLPDGGRVFAVLGLGPAAFTDGGLFDGAEVAMMGCSQAPDAADDVLDAAPVFGWVDVWPHGDGEATITFEGAFELPDGTDADLAGQFIGWVPPGGAPGGGGGD